MNSLARNDKDFLTSLVRLQNMLGGGEVPQIAMAALVGFEAGAVLPIGGGCRSFCLGFLFKT